MSKKRTTFGTVTVPTEAYNALREHAIDAAAALDKAVSQFVIPEALLQAQLMRCAFVQVHRAREGIRDGVVVHPELGWALSKLGLKSPGAAARVPMD